MKNHAINLGSFQPDATRFDADLELILRSNVLVQANSGGGKSHLMRRCIEQAFGLVPQIVIDPEGEFSTLREKFDVVLVGKGGDTPADLRSAALLARRLLELGASAVVDLFEMSKTQRPAWVAAFVQALVDAPKDLWRDLLVYVDEAHEMAPEPGHGISESGGEKACRAALIDLAAKGRKRGYGVIAATQRLGKLSKDFAAELKNVLIGQTFIDIDRERAAGNLGIAKADKADFFARVKNLPPGTFYAMGRAFCLEPRQVKIGPVQTEHPAAGRRQASPPPPTAKIKHLLPQLADLPREAEEKAHTEKELKARIAELERATAKRPAVSAPATTVTRTVEVIPRDVMAAARAALAANQKAIERLGETVAMLTGIVTRQPAAPSLSTVPVRPQPIAAKEMRVRPAAGPSGTVLPKGERQVLTAIAQHDKGVTREQLTILTGFKRSTRDAYVQRLRTSDLVTQVGDTIVATDAGTAALGSDFEPLPTGDALREHWLRRLPDGERRIFEAVAAVYPDAVSRDALTDATEFKRSTRDAYVQRLAARKLVIAGRGDVAASPELFG